MSKQDDLQAFVTEFREGLIGTQPNASDRMCAVVSMPLRAALQVLRGVDTDLVTENGHTFLVTRDGKLRIDPTIDQFRHGRGEKVLIEDFGGRAQQDERLSTLPFIQLLENFKRLSANEGTQLGAREAGSLIATYIYLPLAQAGFFDGARCEAQ